MTRDQAQQELTYLVEQRRALLHQLATPDAQSASLSSGGGSKSFSNRSVSELRAKIKFLDGEIARLEYSLGLAPNPSLPKIISPKYC